MSEAERARIIEIANETPPKTSPHVAQLKAAGCEKVIHRQTIRALLTRHALLYAHHDYR